MRTAGSTEGAGSDTGWHVPVTIGPVTVVAEPGVPGFCLTDSARAALVCDRVRSAVISSGFEWPLCHLTVLGAEVPDLAVALGVLAAAGRITKRHAEAAWREMQPSLGLDGSLKQGPWGEERPGRFGTLAELLAATRTA